MSKAQEIKLYGDIGTWKNDGEGFTGELEAIEKTGCKDLTIRMHCYGGSVFEGNMICNAIQRSKMNIKIVIDGIAASMASVVLMAASEVEIVENGFIMIHTPSCSTDGNAQTHIQAVKLLNDIESDFSKKYAIKSGLSIDQVKQKWFDGLDHWMNADEAVSFGFANRKIPAITGNILNLSKEDVSTMNVKNVYNRYTSILSNTINNEKEMKKELIEYFKLKGVNEESSDTAVMQLIKDKFGEMASAENKKAIKSMVSSAVKEGKIHPSKIDVYEKLGITGGLDVLLAVVESLVKPIRIIDLIKDEPKGEMGAGSQNPKSKKDWTLDDYRKFSPKELANNPKLYNELVEKEYGKE